MINKILEMIKIEDSDSRRMKKAEAEVKKQEERIETIRRKKSSEIINKFVNEWVEIMAQLGISNQLDLCPSPNGMELIEKEGALGILGEIAFPAGTNYGDIEQDKVLKSLEQSLLDGCMFKLLGEKNKKLVKFVAINKWHTIPYRPITHKKIGNSKMEIPLEFGDIFLGYDVTGEPVIVNINKAPHPSIFGGTGSGKSKLLEMMVTNMALTHSPEECHFYFCQISKTDYVKFRKLAHTKAMIIPDASQSEMDSLNEILNMFKYVQQEIVRRQELMKDMLEDGDDANIVAYNRANPKNKLPLMIVWTDESSDLFASESKDKTVKDTRDIIREYAERLARTARSFGIFIVNCLQKSTKSQFSTILKNQAIAKISFSQSTMSESQNAIDSVDAYGLHRYVCALRLFDGTGSDVRYFKCGYAPDWRILKGYLDRAGVMSEHELLTFKSKEKIDKNINQFEEKATDLMKEIATGSSKKEKNNEVMKLKGELENERREKEIYIKQLDSLMKQVQKLSEKLDGSNNTAPYASQISNYIPLDEGDEIEVIVDETNQYINYTPVSRKKK